MQLSEAKHLRVGQLIYSKTRYNSDGTAMKAKVTSVKTWKTRPAEVEVRYKRGMYEYGTINQNELTEFTLREPARKDPKKFSVKRGNLVRR